jgi:dienelactone hydrolase
LDLEDILMKDDAVRFGKKSPLVGVISTPQTTGTGNRLPAVILLNAGLVHRVGPNRLYVKIARSLASAGFLVLRFDFSGVGDSEVSRDDLPFHQGAVIEAKEAMDFLHTRHGVEKFLLVGICSGARVSYLTARDDSRVVGAAVINPLFGGGPAGQRKVNADYYWRVALFSPESWLKAITGRVRYRTLIKTLGSQFKKSLARGHKPPAEKGGHAEGLYQLSERGIHLLLVCSGGDPAANDLREAAGGKLHDLVASGKLTLMDMPEAGHLFTLVSNQERLIETVRNWAQSVVVPSSDVTMPFRRPEASTESPSVRR